MYDSTEPLDIPTDAEMVAGYIDGRFGPDHATYGNEGWDASSWDRFPNAVKVRIAVHADTNDGNVLDCEWGDAKPEEVPGWVTRRRQSGFDPTVYVNRSNWQAARDACAAYGIVEPLWWLAAYDGVAEVPAGTVAKQYANSAITGGHYDLSAVADFWLGVDVHEVGMKTPQYVGQSVTNINVTVGEVAQFDGIWNYPDHGGNRFIVGKVVGYAPGVRVVTLYPPADPDADPTLVLDAQPAYFVVATR